MATFTDGILDSLQAWPSLQSGYVEALAAMFEPVWTIVADQGDEDSPGFVPGWSILLDPNNCPTQWLPYLSQFNGTDVAPGTDDQTARQIINVEAAMIRGTVDAIKAAALRNLVGTAANVGTLQNLGETGGVLPTNVAITSIDVSPLTMDVAPQTITLTDPTAVHTQTFLVLTPCFVGATSIDVYPQVPNYAYPVDTLIQGPFLNVRERWNGVTSTADAYHLTLGFKPSEVINLGTANFVLNPSFEYDTTGGAPAAWTPTTDGTWIPISSGSSLIVRTTGTVTPKYGSRFLDINFSGTQGAAIAMPMPVAVGETYTASCWVQGSFTTGAEPGARLNFGYGSEASPSGASASVTTSSTWQQLSVTYTITSADATAGALNHFWISITGTSHATVSHIYVDGVMVTKTASLQPYADGDTVDYGWDGTPGDSVTGTPTDLVAAVNAVKPAGIIVDFQASEGWTWSESTGTWSADTFSWMDAFSVHQP